ncbi:hypothetical protein BpHYR1_019957 [Brachionus plicatilis]|uniref:AAA domain-containing protein n=1 Tax=Brachionus plicatilis TaxID=10195 RepID=A0A3M7SXM8_BRAPC|nr:hypothetical protein BpHYR1_019957 [Brachionus plicatilis]
MNLDKVTKSICSDAASISSSLHIQRNQVAKKLADRLIDFLNDELMFVMVIWGPSQCGKTYLLTTILDQITPFEKCKDYLSLNNRSVSRIKNKLNNCTNNQFLLIQNLKNTQNMNSLVKFVHKKRQKSIFILSSKQYMLNRKIMKKFQCVTFPVNYLSPNEMRQNLNQLNSIQINKSTWMSKNIFMKNFYNLLKKPKYFKKVKQHWQPENIGQEFSENVVYDQMAAVYSLNSFIYLFKSFALLLDFNIDASIDVNIDVNIDVDSIIQKLAKLNDQFKLVVLNQLLSDLFNEKKMSDIKSGCFVIKVNRYDTELSPFRKTLICIDLKIKLIVQVEPQFRKKKFGKKFEGATSCMDYVRYDNFTKFCRIVFIKAKIRKFRILIGPKAPLKISTAKFYNYIHKIFSAFAVLPTIIKYILYSSSLIICIQIELPF